MTKLKPLLFMASIAFIVAIFHLHGVSSYVELHGTSLFGWLVHVWIQDSPGMDYSHAPLVLCFCVYLIYRQRNSLTTSNEDIYPPAIGFLLLSIVLHLVGLRIQYASISVISVLLALISITAYYFGRNSGRALLFPTAFFLFAVPWPLLANASFPLRLFASNATEVLLNGIAIPVVRQGTSLMTIREPTFALEVADPCSGLRSLMALCALTAGWAYMSKMPLYLKAIFFASAAPIAVIANIARIVSVVIMSLVLDTDKTLTFYHDFSGYLVFVVAVLIVIGESALIDRWTAARRAKQEARP